MPSLSRYMTGSRPDYTRRELIQPDTSNNNSPKELVQAADLVIAMGRDHQVFVREQFGRDIPLFNQICLGHDKPILDLHEAVLDWETDPERARAYVWSVIDVIWATAPTLLPLLR